MAPVAQRRYARVDDDLYDDDGNGPYDKRYRGQKVIADGGKVRVPIYMTDAMPPATRAAMSRRSMLFDANAHRPHYVVVDRADPGVREAERAYHEHNAWLQDMARKGQSAAALEGRRIAARRLYPAAQQCVEAAAGPSCA
jgi:hypothetical protein